MGFFFFLCLVFSLWIYYVFILVIISFNGTDDGKLAQYRKKCLSKLRAKLNMVETNMCSQKWNQIDFSKVPSRAMKKFNKAFAKHDATRYQDWLSKLSAGDKSVKVNAKTLFVHEIVSEYLKNKQKEVNLLLEVTKSFFFFFFLLIWET